MTREPFSSSLCIKTDRYYTTDELFVLMKEKLSAKFVPIDRKKILTVDYIYIQGVDKYRISLCSMKWGMTGKGRIIISQDKSWKEILKDSIPLTIICFITLGIGLIIWRICATIATIFGIEGTKASRALMREFGGEIEKQLSK